MGDGALIDRQRRVPAKITQQKPSSPCGPSKGFDHAKMCERTATHMLHIPIRQHSETYLAKTRSVGQLYVVNFPTIDVTEYAYGLVQVP